MLPTSSIIDTLEQISACDEDFFDAVDMEIEIDEFRRLAGLEDE